jgi:hypothetical protein
LCSSFSASANKLAHSSRRCISRCYYPSPIFWRMLGRSSRLRQSLDPLAFSLRWHHAHWTALTCPATLLLVGPSIQRTSRRRWDVPSRSRSNRLWRGFRFSSSSLARLFTQNVICCNSGFSSGFSRSMTSTSLVTQRVAQARKGTSMRKITWGTTPTEGSCSLA